MAIHKAEIVSQMSLRDQQRIVKRLADGQSKDYVCFASIISTAQSIVDVFRVKHCNYMYSF